MPESCRKLRPDRRLRACRTWESAAVYGACPADVTVTKGENLFPVVDMDKALAELEAEAEAAQEGRPARRGGGAPADRRRWTLTPSASPTSGP